MRMKTVKTFRLALMVAALAAAGGAHALDNGGFMKVADTMNNTSTQPPANNAPGMPGHTEGDKEKRPAASAGASTDASVDNAKQAVTDGSLTTKVKTKLLATKDLKSTGIHVKTKDRVVNLTGTVPSKEQHQLALDTVRSVEGVDNVKDNLKVSSR
nr:BON domain-containing protein [Cupriavidus pauculus]